LQAMERIIQQLGMRPTTRQMAQLLGQEGFGVSHVQVFKDYRTLKNRRWTRIRRIGHFRLLS